MGVEGEKERVSAETTRSAPTSPTEPILPIVNPTVASEKKAPESPSNKIHPAFYVTTWIALSSSIIIFNKWILDEKKANFRISPPRNSHDGVSSFANEWLATDFPITLTCWHLSFATVMTQILSRTTTLLDGRKTVKMTGRIYLRAIVPIGAFFSLSLICGNMTYLYLGVAFIQMLKATTPVAVLLAGWALGTEKANPNTFFKVSFIVIGVIIASYGEIDFVLIGVLFQIGGIVFEALRLVMVQKLLSSAEFKMDPLVSLYYFAPLCAIMNFCVAAFFELPHITMADFYRVGPTLFLVNACVAFALNVSVVFLVSYPLDVNLSLQWTAFLTYTSPDRPHFLTSHDPLRRPQRHPPRRHLRHLQQRTLHRPAMFRLQHRPSRARLLQTRRRHPQSQSLGYGSWLGRLWRTTPGDEESDCFLGHAGRCVCGPGRAGAECGV